MGPKGDIGDPGSPGYGIKVCKQKPIGNLKMKCLKTQSAQLQHNFVCRGRKENPD